MEKVRHQPERHREQADGEIVPGREGLLRNIQQLSGFDRLEPRAAAPM